MRYDSEHKQKTRGRVLKAAAQAIRAQGAHRVAVASVMSKAGLTHGGFYAHFPSKDDLIDAAIDQMFAGIGARFAQLTAGHPPAAALGAYIDFYLSSEHRDAIGVGCPIAALGADVRRLPRRARERFASGVVRLSTILSEQLRELGRPDPALEGSSMVSELVGALSLARGEPDATRSDAILNASRASLKRRLGLKESN